MSRSGDRPTAGAGNERRSAADRAAGDPAVLESLVAAARELAARPEEAGGPVYLLLSHEARFQNPLVPAEHEALRTSEAAHDPEILRVVHRHLLRRPPSESGRPAAGAGEPEATAAATEAASGQPAAAAGDPEGTEGVAEVPSGVFFPVPMARSLARGDALETVLRRYWYERIRVDQDQEWWWRGRPVGERMKAFLHESLRFEPELGLYLFEYKIHEGWWDKSYFDAEITPWTANRLEPIETTAESGTDREGQDAAPAGAESPHVAAVVQSGARIFLDLASGLRVDARERLFAATPDGAEVLLSDTIRFQLLGTAHESLESVEIEGARVALRWPGADADPEAEPEPGTG